MKCGNYSRFAWLFVQFDILYMSASVFWRYFLISFLFVSYDSSMKNISQNSILLNISKSVLEYAGTFFAWFQLLKVGEKMNKLSDVKMFFFERKKWIRILISKKSCYFEIWFFFILWLNKLSTLLFFCAFKVHIKHIVFPIANQYADFFCLI